MRQHPHRLAAAFLALSILAAGATAQEMTPEQREAAMQQLLETNVGRGSSIPAGTVLFEAMGKEWTKEEFEEIVRPFPPRGLAPRPNMPREYSLDNFSIENIREGIRTFVAGQAAAQRAKDQGLEIPEQYQEQYDRQLSDFLRDEWLKGTGARDVPRPTDEETLQYYEENKSLWEREELFVMRTLFLSTYKEHVVQEGETLESIAEKVCGDASKADQIRDPNTPDKRPRMDAVKATNGEELAPLALVPGEVLLVPMPEEEAAAVEQKIRELHGQLEGGADFAALAMEHSENNTAGNRMQVKREMNGKPVLPELIEAFLKIEDGQYSEPIRTRHGWQVILRDNYRPGGAPDFETVKENARSLLTSERQRSKFAVVAMESLAEAGHTINDDVLMTYDQPGGEQRVIIQLPDMAYTAEAFQRDFGERLKPDTPLEKRREMLLALPGVQRRVDEHETSNPTLRESPEANRMRQAMDGLYFLTIMAEQRAQETDTTPTEMEIEEAYLALPDKNPPPPLVFIHQITMRPAGGHEPGTPEHAAALEAKRAELAERLADVQNLSDFEIIARRASEDDFAERGGSRGPVTEDQVDPAVWQHLVNDAPKGTMFGPVVVGNEVVAYWVNDKRLISPEVHEQTLREQVTQRLVRDKRNAVGEALLDELVAEAGLVIHLPEDVGPSPALAP